MYRVSRALMVCAIVLVSGIAHGQTFKKEILIDNLDQPQGIAVDLKGNLFFTEVPQPGVFGGENRVSRYRFGRTKVIAQGEPYPTNLTVDFAGNVYWTCQTAGVILRSARRGNRAPEMFLTGLNNPVGIDAPLFFPGLIGFTEVPTPGVNGDNGGENKVKLGLNVFGRELTGTLSDGEPEPSDIAIANNGTMYWTCKTAGVILKRDISGEISVVKSGLDSPVGLDIDFHGRLYWTEVPTPGVSGEDGGRNRVVLYIPWRDRTVVISEGEPEPADVAVSYFGREVYWTCKTAGVIIRAKR